MSTENQTQTGQTSVSGFTSTDPAETVAVSTADNLAAYAGKDTIVNVTRASDGKTFTGKLVQVESDGETAQYVVRSGKPGRPATIAASDISVVTPSSHTGTATDVSVA